MLCVWRMCFSVALEQTDKGSTHKLFYSDQMTRSHKTNERVLCESIHRNFKCIEEDDRLSLIIYYMHKKTKQLIMKNNSTRKQDNLHQTNELY